MFETIEIGKLDSARRHLETGITMFFEERDPVVVYTVAWTAYQVLSDLCKLAGVQRQVEDSEVLESIGAKKDVITAFRKPRNFFQHADKDPEEKVTFYPDSSWLVLMLAGDMYHSLSARLLPAVGILRTWFYTKSPERVPLEVRQLMNSLPIKVTHRDYAVFLEMLRQSANKSMHPTADASGD